MIKLNRQEKWKKYDEAVKNWQQREDAPAFVQEITVGGLWSVQKLWTPKQRDYSFWYRFFRNPPPPVTHEPFYNGWPGDHRGWMRFQSAEEARDFYRFAEGIISFEEYQQVDTGEYSGKTIKLDDEGNFKVDDTIEKGARP